MKTTLKLSLIAAATILAFSAHASGAKHKTVKKVKPAEVSEINLVANEPGDAVIANPAVYHLTMEQLNKLDENQVNTNISLHNKMVHFNVSNKDNGLGIPAYNFQNLPGSESQLHLMWISTDLKKAQSQTFSFEPTDRIGHLEVQLPSDFNYNNVDQCNAIIFTYQLKGSDKPTNVVRYSYAIDNDYGEKVMTVSEDKPSFCNIKAPDIRDNVTITKNHVVSFSNNPKLSQTTGRLALTAHTTENGELILLEAKQTVLINKDFSSLSFLLPKEAKGSTDMMKKFYGLPYSSNKVDSGDYIVGLNFEDSGKNHWAWAQIQIK